MELHALRSKSDEKCCARYPDINWFLIHHYDFYLQESISSFDIYYMRLRGHLKCLRYNVIEWLAAWRVRIYGNWNLDWVFDRLRCSLCVRLCPFQRDR
jgi:hypothetical protein